MSRTNRNIPYDKYWAMTKDEAKEWLDANKFSPRYFDYFYRAVLLHGTDAGNHTVNSKRYFKFAHRKGRRIERDKLRPHFIDEDYDFDDSEYRIKYKGMWWEIF